MHFKYDDTDRWKVKGWKKTYHAKTNKKETVMVMLMSKYILQRKEN